METEFERVLIEGHGTPLVDQCHDPWCRDGIHHIGPLGGWWHVDYPPRRYRALFDPRVQAVVNSATIVTVAALIVIGGN